jgi:polyisoprenoid-binding protein YceI
VKHLILPLTLALSTLGVHAVEYKTVVPNQSEITFAYKQMGVGMDGRFKSFTARISLDPAKLAQAKVSFDVDLASFETGTEADQEVLGKAWFNTAAFPKAQFVAQHIKALSPQQWEVSGTLSIKGKTVDVKFPLQYQAQAKGALFKGQFVLRRADFGVGEGSWSKFDIIANDVQVRFQLTAQ